MFESLVKRCHSHRPHAFGDHISDLILDHSRDNSSAEAEAVREVRRDVEFSSAHMYLVLCRLTKRDDSRVETMNQSAEADKVNSCGIADS
jgi:hypothetical protein